MSDGEMLSSFLTGTESIRNEDIRRAVRCCGDKGRLRWFGPIQREDSERIGGNWLLRLELAGSRPAARTQRRFMNVVEKEGPEGGRWRGRRGGCESI